MTAALPPCHAAVIPHDPEAGTASSQFVLLPPRPPVSVFLQEASVIQAPRVLSAVAERDHLEVDRPKLVDQALTSTKNNVLTGAVSVSIFSQNTFVNQLHANFRQGGVSS